MKMLEELKGRFAELSEREQKMVLLSAIVVIIAVIYFVIYAPLQNSIDLGNTKINAQKEALTWVTQNANKAIQLKQSGSGTDSYKGSLPQAVNQTATRQNISITRMQPQSDDILVWVDSADFNNVINWLQALENMGIKITEADIAEGDGSGTVKIRRLRLSKV